MRPGPFLKTFFSALPGGVYLTETFFKGHAARAYFLKCFFCPLGHSASGGGLFARPKSPSKTAPSGGPAGLCASLPTPSGASLNSLASGGPGWRSAEARNASTAPFVATLGNTPHLQSSWSHSKQPRKIPFTRNPLGASLLCALQRGSRDVGRKLGGVSSSF